MDRPRVCIVGAGVLGLATAYYLVRGGCSEVTVVEREHPGAGSAALASGVIGAQHLSALDIQLRTFGLLEFERFERDHGLRVTHNGYLRLGHDGALAESFARSVEIQAALGRPGARVLERAEVATLVPDLRCDDVEVALFGPDDGYLDGYLLCGMLAELVTSGGGRVVGRAEIVGVEERRGGGYVISTTRDDVSADIVVIAAGAWAQDVARQFGVNLPVVGVRHYAAIVHAGRDLPYVMPTVVDFVPGVGGSGLNFRHERADQLVAEVHSEYAVDAGSDGEGGRLDAASFPEALAGQLLDRLPGLSDARIGHSWSGYYPESEDGRVWVGPHPERTGVFSVAGAGGYGLQLAPGLGRVAADWVLEGGPVSIPGARALVPVEARA